MERVFVDTDIILDLLASRDPFYSFAAELFSRADRHQVKLHVSTLCFANLHYLLSRQLGPFKAKNTLLQLKALVTTLPVLDKTIELALASDFRDFEDAIQYYCALEHSIPILLTRNLRDYQNCYMSILTAEEYLKSRKWRDGEEEA